MKKFNNSIEKHLKSRGVNAQKVRVIFNIDDDYATFFLYNLSGQLVGYQHYNPKGIKKQRQGNKEFDKDTMKYYTYVTGKKSEKALAVWGLESYKLDAPYLFVTEGIFDAVKIQNAGYPAIATLSNDPNMGIKSWLKTLPQTIIVIADNDDNNSGNKLLKFGNISKIVPTPYKDLGDMPQEEVNLFISNIVNNLT